MQANYDDKLFVCIKGGIDYHWYDAQLFDLSKPSTSTYFIHRPQGHHYGIYDVDLPIAITFSSRKVSC